MVCDFGIVKKTLRNWLDATIDHCLIVAAQSSNIEYKHSDDIIDVLWNCDNHSQPAYSIRCRSPEQAITLIDTDAINPENVAAWCIEQLRPLLPDTIDRIVLSFVPEAIQHHSYHYSHGLKKHQGNCQRIAHGHRSTIEIFQDDERNHSLEAKWCEAWRDIYIGSADDLQKKTSTEQTEYYHFAYCSEQGEFELSLPSSRCSMINTDSTVEFIAQHIANTLKQQHPQSQFKVRAFEGIAKGAIAFS